MNSKYVMAFICLIVVVKSTFAQELPSLQKQFEEHYSAEEFGKAAKVGANILLNPELRPEGEEQCRFLYKTLASHIYANMKMKSVEMLDSLERQTGTPLFKYYVHFYRTIFLNYERREAEAHVKLKAILKENHSEYLHDSLKAKIYHNLSIHRHLEPNDSIRLYYLAKSFEMEKKLMLKSANYISYNKSVYTYCEELLTRFHQYEKAYEIFKTAMSQPFNQDVKPDNIDIYKVYVDLLFTLGREKEAESYIEQLMHFFENDHIYFFKTRQIKFLNNLVYHYWKRRQFTTAIYYGLQIRTLLKKNNNNPDFIGYYTSVNLYLARCYFNLGQYDKMMYYYNKDIELAKKSNYRNTPTLLMSTYLDAGYKLAELGEKELALTYADSGRHIYDIRYVKFPNKNGLNKLGLIYYHSGLYDEALYYLEKVNDMLQKGDYHDYIVFDNIFERACCYNKMGDYHTANTLYKNVNDTIIENYPLLRDKTSSFQRGHLAYLYMRINVHQVKNFNDLYRETQDSSYLDEALLCIEEASKVIELIRNHQHYDVERLAMGEQYFNFTEQSAKTTMTLYEMNKEPDLLQKAFNYIQKGKAYALIQELNEKKIKLNSGVATETINELNTLKKQYNLYLKNYNDIAFQESGDSLIMDQLNSSIKLAKSKIDSINKKIEINNPEYLQLRQQNAYLTIAEIQERLGTNQVVADYFLTNERIFRYTIDKTNVHCDVIDIDSTFHSNLEFAIEELNTTFYGQGNTNRIQKYALASYQLYEKLIGDISHVIRGKELIVIPHSRLSYLPFETLLTKEYASPKPRFKDFPWFIKEQVISYSYNASLLNNTQRKPIAFNNVLAFAPKYTGAYQFDSLYVSRAAYHDTLLMPLKGAQKEIEAIAQSFNTKVYKGKAANKQNFIESLQNNDVLHLAMHSINDIHEPFNSQLVFASSDSINGSFKANELYGYNIQSPLAVLSACSTGSGKKYKGEGVLSMARAFTYAGVESQVMTLWPVDDQSGADITKHFYERLKEGDSKNTALQKSKLEYLASADAIKSHPYYWANYVLSGNTTSIKQKSTKYLILSVLAFALLAVASLIVYRKRKKVAN